MTIISTHPKMLHEILDVINKQDDVVSALRACLHIHFVRQYLNIAISEEWSTIDIEKTETKDYNYHISMAGAFLLNRHTFKVVSEIIMNKDVVNSAKTIQYKALMEMLYIKEAHILNAILTKNLTSLYPRITFSALNNALSYNKINT